MLDLQIADKFIHNLNGIVELWNYEYFPIDTIAERYFDHFALHVHYLSQHLSIQATPAA
jgi:hypothetical protein